MAICVLGSINRDVVLRVARFPRAGETLVAKSVTRGLGGKGANQAVGAARAGAAVRMIGCVGDDADGRALLAGLGAEGVDCSAVAVAPDQATGTAHILVDDAGENQIVVAAGANATVRGGTPGDAAVVLAQCEVPGESVAAFFGARPPGAVAILNAAPYHPAARALFALADVIVVNETELGGYCGSPPPTGSPDRAATLAESLLSAPTQRIVVTLGAAGSVTVGGGSRMRASAPSAAVVDTTGAGDCFCGYLAAGLAGGRPLADAVAFAHRAAAIAIGRAGAANAIPFLAEVAGAGEAEQPSDPT